MLLRFVEIYFLLVNSLKEIKLKKLMRCKKLHVLERCALPPEVLHLGST